MFKLEYINHNNESDVLVVEEFDTLEELVTFYNTKKINKNDMLSIVNLDAYHTMFDDHVYKGPVHDQCEGCPFIDSCYSDIVDPCNKCDNLECIYNPSKAESPCNNCDKIECIHNPTYDTAGKSCSLDLDSEGENHD